MAQQKWRRKLLNTTIKFTTLLIIASEHVWQSQCLPEYEWFYQGSIEKDQIFFKKNNQRIILEKIAALKKKFGFHYILDPFKFKVTYLTRNLTCLLYMALRSDLATNGVTWGWNDNFTPGWNRQVQFSYILFWGLFRLFSHGLRFS
jgi:hypothetical protein